MTKMASMPLYGKNLWKSSSQEPNGRWPWNLICSIRDFGTTKFVQMMTLGWPWSFIQQGQIRSLGLLYGKRQAVDWFFGSYCSLWHQSIYLQAAKWFFYKYQRSRSSIDLCPGFLIFSSLILFSSKTSVMNEAKLYVEALLDEEMKVCSWDLGHMIKMAAVPIYNKNLWKSSSLESNDRCPWSLVCTIRYSGCTKFVQMVTLSWP